MDRRVIVGLLPSHSANHFGTPIGRDYKKGNTELTKTHRQSLKSNDTMVSCILPYYIHTQIYTQMHVYIHIYKHIYILYIQTFENPPLVHSLVHNISYTFCDSSRLGSLSTITIQFLHYMNCNNLKRFKFHGALHRKWSSSMVLFKV